MLHGCRKLRLSAKETRNGRQRKKTIELIDKDAEKIELEVLKPTLGVDVIDVRGLGTKGYFTYDPGFTSTASCESKITYIDGDKGILLHRGYPIDQLATNSTYLKVCYIVKRLNFDYVINMSYSLYFRRKVLAIKKTKA